MSTVPATPANVPTGGSAAPVAPGSSADKGKASGKSIDSLFNKTLTVYMNAALGAAPQAAPDAGGAIKEDAGQTETPLSQLFQSLTELLQGNAAGTSDVSGGTGSKLTDNLNKILDAITDLLKKGTDLDDALASDPSLMLQLQSWIQQAMLFMQNGTANPATIAAGENTDNSQGAAAMPLPSLPLLAETPQTIGLALQDTVQLLKDQINMTGSQGKLDVASFGNLMNQLQTTLQQAVKKPGEQQPVQQSAPEQQVSQDNTPNTIDFADSVKEVVQTKPTVAFTSKDDSSDQQANDDTKGKQDSNSSIITAGQLQLRDGAVAAPVKAVAQAPVPVEKFAQEMSGFVVSKMDIVKQQGMSEAKITLFPDNLGQVDVKISLHNGQVVAQFVTEHAFAKDSLEQQMSQLRTALQSQGLQVEKLEVTQNPTLSSHMYQDGKQPGSGGFQQRQNGKRREANDEEGLAKIDTIEEWNDWVNAVQSKQGQDNYGSSFTAKA